MGLLNTLQTDGLAVAWLFTVGYSLCFLVPAAAIVVYLRPSAARSEFWGLLGQIQGGPSPGEPRLG